MAAPFRPLVAEARTADGTTRGKAFPWSSRPSAHHASRHAGSREPTGTARRGRQALRGEAPTAPAGSSRTTALAPPGTEYDIQAAPSSLCLSERPKADDGQVFQTDCGVDDDHCDQGAAVEWRLDPRQDG